MAKKRVGRPKVKDMDESITFRLSRDLKTGLRELADDEARSLSQYVQLTLQKHVEAMKSKRGRG